MYILCQHPFQQYVLRVGLVGQVSLVNVMDITISLVLKENLMSWRYEMESFKFKATSINLIINGTDVVMGQCFTVYLGYLPEIKFYNKSNIFGC